MISGFLGALAILVVILIIAYAVYISSPPARKRIVLLMDPKAYLQVTPADARIRSKADVYKAIGDMARGPAIGLLNEISLELVTGDPQLNIPRAQDQVPALGAIIQELAPTDFIFLCLTGVNHMVVTKLVGVPIEPM